MFYLARLMTGGAVTLPLLEVVGVDVLALGGGPSDDLVPLDRLDVTQVVVVQNTNTALQNI